jgi:hypothetical protein
VLVDTVPLLRIICAFRWTQFHLSLYLSLRLNAVALLPIFAHAGGHKPTILYYLRVLLDTGLPFYPFVRTYRRKQFYLSCPGGHSPTFLLCLCVQATSPLYLHVQVDISPSFPDICLRKRTQRTLCFNVQVDTNPPLAHICTVHTWTGLIPFRPYIYSCRRTQPHFSSRCLHEGGHSINTSM